MQLNFTRTRGRVRFPAASYLAIKKQIVMQIKLTTFILLIAATTVSARGYSQKITLKENDAPLTRVMHKIERQTSYQFLFFDSDILQAKKVTINVKNADIGDVLQQCFKGQPLTYKIAGNTIVIGLRTSPTPIPADTTINVHGRIMNEKGQPVPGATIRVKGSAIVTVVDNKGVFDLENIDENATLVISSVGYETKEIAINGKSFLQITLIEKINILDETQIIAYGTTTKRLSTGDITTVSSKTIEQQPVNNPLLALQGRVPGLSIIQSTGIPGGGITIRVQGQNSLSRGNEPLYVIDGVPYTSQLLPNISGIFGILGSNGEPNTSYAPVGGGNPLSFINPADIESIDVLKDADATSIYGSRAAQGAILITTKKGKAGQTKVDLNIQNGWGKVTRRVDLLNTRQYLEMRHEAFRNDGLSPRPGDYDINGAWDTTRYTDWQKVLIGGTAHYTDAQATVSGGTANTNFLVGAGYHRETTVFPGDLADRRGSLHFNINNVSANRKFQLQLTGNYMVDNNQLISPDLTDMATRLAPDAPALYNHDGTLNWAPLANGTSSWYNPLAYLYNKYTIKTDNLISSALASYQVLPGLDIKSSFGYTNLQTNETNLFPLVSFAPETRPSSSRYTLFTNNNIHSWQVEPQVTYKRKIGTGTLEALAGATLSQNNSNGQQLYGSGYNSDLGLEDIRSAPFVGVNSTILSVYKYGAVFGRINYNWQDKYIINLTARRDGSSRFGSENLFHNFGSVAGAWIFSNEAFMQRSLPFVSFGKLRGSYGTTGSDQIGDYQFLSLYSPYAVPVAYQGTTALAPAGLPNPYLQWEETKKWQFGLDLGFLKDRILLNVNYYHNRSSNLLQGYALPLITGNGSININFPAIIQNTGWELSLNTTNVTSRNFSWNSSINLTVPRNKLVAFPGLKTSTYASAYVIGQPITQIKSFSFAGVDPATGLYQFTDKDGKITSAPDFSKDRIPVNIDPRFYGGFQNSFHYKELELDILFQFVKQTGRNYFFGRLPGYFLSLGYAFAAPVANQPEFVWDRWQKPGDISAQQRFSATYLSNVRNSYNDATSSTGSYSDASYIRLKNLSLSWQLPGKWQQKAHLQNARIYVQGQNLLTITRFKGMDPENQRIMTLPSLRVLTTGIQVTL